MLSGITTNNLPSAMNDVGASCLWDATLTALTPVDQSIIIIMMVLPVVVVVDNKIKSIMVMVEDEVVVVV